MIIRPSTFKTPAWARLTKVQRSVVLALATWADRDGRNCRPSLASLAEATGLRWRAISAALHGLDAVGVAVVLTPGRPNEYDLSGLLKMVDPCCPATGVDPCTEDAPLHSDSRGRPLLSNSTPVVSRHRPLSSNSIRSGIDQDLLRDNVRDSHDGPPKPNGKAHQRRPRPAAEIPPDHIELARHLSARIIEHRPAARHTDATIRQWAAVVGLMVRRDGRSLEDIRTLIDEVHDMEPTPSGFTWRSNILSMDKLRQRWQQGKIFVGMTGGHQTTHAAAGGDDGWQ